MDGKGPVRRWPPARPGRSGRHLYLVRGPTAPTPLAIETVDVLYVVLVRVLGELDAGTAPQLATALHLLESRHCELDLVRLSFMDSVGLTLLLAHQRRAAAAGAGVRTAKLASVMSPAVELAVQGSFLIRTRGTSRAHANSRAAAAFRRLARTLETLAGAPSLLGGQRAAVRGVPMQRPSGRTCSPGLSMSTQCGSCDPRTLTGPPGRCMGGARYRGTLPG
ncbi:anti-anti-sigma factor [Streptomyces sp. V4I8]